MSGKPTPSRKHQVWERDGWTCLVPRCWHPEEDGGRAIDPALAGTDGDWSPTVDHIVMRCDGGTNTWTNLRSAHKICNIRWALTQGMLAIGARIGAEAAARLADLVAGLASKLTPQ